MHSIPIRAFRGDARTVVRELGFLENRWAPADLAHARCHILLELERAGVLRAAELAERLRLDRSVISRHVRQLLDADLVYVGHNRRDHREKPLALTHRGQEVVAHIHEAAEAQVSEALDLLTDDEQQAVLRGMALYAKALQRARRQRAYTIRPLQPADDPQVTALIQAVMPEFGASGPGFALHDPEVLRMSQHYHSERARYFVVEHDGQVVGGGGFAALDGGEPGVCELRKMYFLPEARGLGLGARLLTHVLAAASEAGFDRCYLETLETMSRARRLYESFGFRKLPAPLGATGHFGCDAWYALELAAPE